jgi:signal transduction histidine kinase
MKSTLRRDLGFQLLALYLLFVGPVVLASLVFDHLAAQRLEADVKATDLGLARAIAQETNTVMDSSMEAVRQLAKNPAVIEADPNGMQELFQFLLGVRPDINLIYRLSSDGHMLYHYPTGPGSTVGWDFSFRDYYKLALDTHQALMSKGRISPTTQQPVATAVMPLWADNGDFLGLVATNIKLQSLSHTLASIVAEHHSEDTFEIVIIDSAGQIIAHPSPPQLLSEEAKKPEHLTRAVLTGQSGNMILDDSQGEEMLYSYVPIPSAGWGVVVSRPTASAFATPQATHRGVLFLIAFFLAIGLLFWVALSRQVIKPLEHLAAFSQSVGLKRKTSDQERQAVNRLSSRADQIGHLSRSLTRMEQAIDARLKELSTLVQTSAAVVSTLDSKIVLDRILEQVELLMDINMCTIVALDEQRGMFRAQASRGLSQRYTDQLAINPSEPLSVTLRAIRSGEPVQISDTETDESFATSRPRARAEGYRSILAVPLNTQHAPPSALLVYRPEPHQFSEREINLLTNFANHAAMAIENATLYARSDMRLKEQTRRLEALIQSLQDGLILENLQGSVLYANRRISELVDLPLEDITGSPASHLMDRLLSRTVAINGQENTNGRANLEAAMQGSQTPSAELAVRFPRQIRYLRLQVFEVTDAAGMRIGRGQILRDITHNREIDRMKSSLISTVSHELRTPLAAIKGYATTLLAEDVQWDALTQKEFLEIISTETDRLSNLVNDLLDMSRIEAGSLKVNQVECNLEELIRRAIQTSHPAPGDRMQINLLEGLPPIFADQNRIVSVLRNLIENAAKYSGETTPIRVSAIRQSDTIVVRVEDEGPGIPAEDSERIFESFYRVENGLSRSAPGAGLGLSISRGFVHAHGGKIWMEPRSQGTCIAFSLPVLKQKSRAGDLSEPSLQMEE